MVSKAKSPIIFSSAFSSSQKKEDIDLWAQWYKTRSKADLEVLLKQMENIIHRAVADKRGSLPDTYLELEAKKYAVQAFESFNPKLGVALSTHVTNNLRQLSRLNYTYRQAVRTPEHLQRKIGEFLSVRESLSEFYGRAPTSSELSEELKWNVKEVHRLEAATREELSDMKEVSVEGATGFSDQASDDPMVAFLYHSLSKADQSLFEMITGYGGKKIESNDVIAKKLNLSYSQLSYQKRLLTDKIRQHLHR